MLLRTVNTLFIQTHHFDYVCLSKFWESCHNAREAIWTRAWKRGSAQKWLEEFQSRSSGFRGVYRPWGSVRRHDFPQVRSNCALSPHLVHWLSCDRSLISAIAHANSSVVSGTWFRLESGPWKRPPALDSGYPGLVNLATDEIPTPRQEGRESEHLIKKWPLCNMG